MDHAPRTTTALTAEQRRLVRENLGLIAVHLRRFVTNLATPRRDREWEDLFQEGCLGLIRAALLYREERGIPFAAFALPRIHNAVSRALQTRFRNVYVPPKRKRPPSSEMPMRDRNNPHERPREYSMGHEPAAIRSPRPRHDPAAESATAEGGESIGDRLRAKYEHAVRRAHQAMAQRASSRGDREALLEVLERERFLVPHDEDRRPLRQIARDTKSSYARVAQCDKRMGELIRRFLEEDAEFKALREFARRSPAGTNDVVDPTLERELADACAEQFAARLRDADPATRSAMIASLLDVSDAELHRIIRDRFREANPDDRTRIMDRSMM